MKKCLSVLLIGIMLCGCGAASTSMVSADGTETEITNDDEKQEEIKTAPGYGGDSVKSGYSDDDLVYREYSWGHDLEKGYEILIERAQIICEMENVQAIAVILNGNMYKEISVDNSDIEFTLEQSGHYAFLAIDSEGNSVDVTSIVNVNIPADGGAIILK